MENNEPKILANKDDSNIQIIEGIFGIDVNLINDISKDHPELTKQLLISISETLKEETRRKNEYHELMSEHEKLSQYLLQRQIKNQKRLLVTSILDNIFLIVVQLSIGLTGYNALKLDHTIFGYSLIIGAMFLHLFTIFHLFTVYKTLKNETEKKS